jgi:hypothetical protein
MGLQFQARLFAAVVLPGMAMAQQIADRTAPAGIGEAIAKLRETAERAQPSELKAESAIFLQRRLGVWLESDAKKLFGEPRRHRDAVEENSVTGSILAFPDPTSRYREFELLFDRQAKTLRAVYIYPWHMSWSECRELWGEDVNTTQVANGNLFRSYRTRRLDVLLDKAGNVINLGIY